MHGGGGISLLIVVLCIFKFGNVWAKGIHSVFGLMDGDNYESISIVAPMGLSFYILTSIGYMIDVYRGDIECEDNFAMYALFISFFPNILSGPIERSRNLLEQIRKGTCFSYDKVKSGLLMMLWGYFLKLLIADRIAVIVNAAFAGYTEQTGATMLIAVIFYGIQLYADFAGYSYIAMGIASTLGFSLLDNFRQPYFARNIKEFWERWHISLSSWLKDYVYISLGGNRHGKIRQCVNLFITFVISGIWHGNGCQFLIWGMIHGCYQIAAKLSVPLRTKIFGKLNIKRNCFSYYLFQAAITFGLVDFAWLFFRASSVQEAAAILKNIVLNFHLGTTIENRLYLVGYNVEYFYILLIELVIWLGVDLIHEKQISVRLWLDQQNKVFRWLLYICFGMILVIGIIHDYGHEASTFIYTQF